MTRSWNNRAVFIAALLVTAVVAAYFFGGAFHASKIADLLRRQNLPDNIADWQQFDGIWQGAHGTFSDLKGGGGDKALAGSPNWANYTIDTDIRFDSDRNFRWGDAGIIVRASDATIGTDAYNGYYAGLRLRDHMLLFGRTENEYVELATKQLPEAITVGTWYHLKVSVNGCTFRATVSSADRGNLTDLNHTDNGCLFRRGQIGLRTYHAQSSWRDVHVQSLY
jgi:hypothetical protein